MAKQTFSLLFMIRRVSLLKTGESPIYMRMTLAGQRIELQLKRRVLPKLWNQKKERAIGKDSVSIEINMYLESIRSQVYEILRNLEDEGLPITLSEIKDRFIGKKSKANQCKMFFAVFQEEIDRMESLIGIDLAKITVGRYKLCLLYFKEMYARQSKASDIALKDINKALIIQFETFMKVDKNLCQNTVIRYMKCFKKIINIGLGNGWIKINPFLGIKFREEKVKKDVLTMDEVMRIYNKEFSIPRLERTRDIFVFCCFTGLAFADLYNLSEENLRTYFDDHLWINIPRQKTNVVSNIRLLDILHRLINKYRDLATDGKVFPVPSYQVCLYNIQHPIAKRCGITKHLTWHCFRHTMATEVCMTNGVPIEMVSSILGHKSIKTTQVYAKITKEKLNRDMERLSDRLAGIKEFAVMKAV